MMTHVIVYWLRRYRYTMDPDEYVFEEKKLRQRKKWEAEHGVPHPQLPSRAFVPVSLLAHSSVNPYPICD